MVGVGNGTLVGQAGVPAPARFWNSPIPQSRDSPRMNWFRLPRGRRSRRPPRSDKQPSYKPRLECLEDRSLPAALTIATATDVAPGDAPPPPTPNLAP